MAHLERPNGVNFLREPSCDNQRRIPFGRLQVAMWHTPLAADASTLRT